MYELKMYELRIVTSLGCPLTFRSYQLGYLTNLADDFSSCPSWAITRDGKTVIEHINYTGVKSL